jgi:rare lipoprotein A
MPKLFTFALMKKVILFSLLLMVAEIAHAQIQTGKASFYADSFEGKPTASGEKYKASKFTAAHKSLPFGTVLKVTNLANNESVEVTVNDRGPFNERVIDLSKAAAEKLKFINQGTTEVKIEVVDAGDGKGKTQPVFVDNVTVEEKEYYALDIEKKAPSSFGIQLGTYQELVNLLRITDHLKTTYKKQVTVQVKVVNGAKYYSLIIGAFSSRKKADDFIVKVKREFPDSFVVDFSKK